MENKLGLYVVQGGREVPLIDITLIEGASHEEGVEKFTQMLLNSDNLSLTEKIGVYIGDLSRQIIKVYPLNSKGEKV